MISCLIYHKRRCQRKFENVSVTTKDWRKRVETGSSSKPSKLPGEFLGDISDTYEEYGVNNSYEVYRSDNLYEEYTERYRDYKHFRSNFVSKWNLFYCWGNISPTALIEQTLCTVWCKLYRSIKWCYNICSKSPRIPIKQGFF